MKIKTDPGSIYQEYLNDIDYKTTMGFVKKWPEYTRFIEGKQWPAPTDETKHMPRPVVNICDQTVENKRSNILSQQLKMQFRVKEMPVDNEELSQEVEDVAQSFTDMAENTWYDILQDTLLKEYTNDAISLGAGFVHYYFDNSYKGGTYKKYIGKMKGEVIDPMDLILGNNQLKPYQLQMQPWFTIKRRRDFNTVVEISKKRGKDWDKIEPDPTNSEETEKYDSAKVESKNASEVTTYTKYFKKNGEVYWVEVTKNAVVVKETRLSPTEECKFELYPGDMLGFKRRRKCAYYRSMIEDIIPNQKSLNWGLGMQLLSVQQTAWPKIIAKVNALTQAVTNTPGEILIDNYGGGGDGFKYMQMPNTPNTAPALTQTLLDMTRSVTGVTEVSTGEQIGANMAAAAIIALQNQAQKPNDDYMNDVVASVKRTGEIWEQFFKCFYNIPRVIRTKDEDGQDAFKEFDGTKGRGIEFDLMVDVGPSSVYSESLQVSILDNYADRQWIDKYQHAEYMPKNTLSQGLREAFKKEQEEAQELAEQQAMMQQQQANQQSQVDAVLSQLTPEERQAVEADPSLLDGLGV